METCTKQDLIAKGYREFQAREIIREAKELLVKNGCSFYLSKGRGRVPKWAIEKILGYELETGEEKAVKRG
ncbi:DUF3173 family protein [Enterococcus sp. LJL128]